MLTLKLFSKLSLLLWAGLAAGSFANAQDRYPPDVVTRYCSGCHGLSGIAQPPYVPRLAGLAQSYLDRRIQTFKGVSRPPVDELLSRRSGRGDSAADGAKLQMVGISHVLSSEDLKTATRFYSGQQPSTRKHSGSKLAETGKLLYLNGVPSQNVPACGKCHGIEAVGGEGAPRLAGQDASYLKKQIALFREGGRMGSTMTQVARNLEDDQARAISAYLEGR